ncbi:MAG: hypothetical protein EAZ45_02825, partial [Oscillatoriales cyanobacterium]
ITHTRPEPLYRSLTSESLEASQFWKKHFFYSASSRQHYKYRTEMLPKAYRKETIDYQLPITNYPLPDIHHFLDKGYTI